ncbi:unnamed protein product [Symbiodinium pilosum]|uniref:Uncharacterized protein n=1 Tax=Symbiodinium pilosum TaxID=2952 RepID=A0A812UF74_SYMPI|nr:unnamed protein product [Symbiodinium pilosum]
MEIRVDAAEGNAAPKETFVSMRIGDFQKQSRFGAAKTYKFPKMEDPNGFARIEVFQRVGHLTVSLGKLHQSDQSVEVPVEMPGMSHLPMRLGLQGASPEANPEPKAKNAKVKTKLDAAQKYLADHHLEEVIADAMREVIHEKPAEPLTFLSSQILKHAAKKPELLPRIDLPTAPIPPSATGNRKANPSEKLPPIGGKPETAGDLNRLRLEARDALLQSAQNGSLAAVLSADQSAAENLGSLRKEAAAALINAARDGSLDVALRETRAGQEGDELEELRQQARATLLQGARDGSLKAALQSTKEEENNVEDLRVQARDALLRASINGTLEKALKEGKPDKKAQATGQGTLEDLRLEAREAFLLAAQDGSLEKALNEGKTLQAPSFKYTPSVGSWLQKKPYQVPRPWYYNVHGETEDDKVIKDLQSVIAEKEREIENLKATLKSSGLDLQAPAVASGKPEAAPAAAAKAEPAPAPASTSLTPFRPYYAAHLRTVKPDALQKLYAKFPAQPKPVSAPKAPEKPEQAAKPAELKSTPAAAAPVKMFAKLPSVGTWLAPNPAKLAQASPAVQTKAPDMQTSASAPSVAPAPQKFAKMPSVGTWLAPNPAKWEDKKETKVVSKEAPQVVQAAEPQAARKPFKQLPSVGTWLAFRPFEEPAKLVPILERTHSKLLCMNKEELITGYENEIRKRDEEIAKLKSSNKA